MTQRDERHEMQSKPTNAGEYGLSSCGRRPTQITGYNSFMEEEVDETVSPVLHPIPLTVNFGFVLRGSAPCTERKSFVRISFENNVMPVPPPGIGNENFIFAYLFMFIAAGGYLTNAVARRYVVRVKQAGDVLLLPSAKECIFRDSGKVYAC